MDNEEWQRALVARSGAAVKHRRTELGLTGQNVCDACAELGFAITPSTLSKLERGARPASSFGVIECLALAKALDIAPALLIFPVAHTSSSVEIGTGQEFSAWEATAWLTGETAMASDPAPGTPRGHLEALRAHGRALQAALSSTHQAGERRRRAMRERDDTKRAQLTQAADAYEGLARQDYDELSEIRDLMQANGLNPPPLPTELVFMDTTAPAPDGDA
ncbi:helix-turn-helix domain-containing protein [Streptacidiphilus sp. BW17]|uniref:helix-turn-helix domain-containing protein n=1 Tax=unclassified Streptacidiphilus TaxID=2643834 RepID=UPI003513DDC4